MPLTALVTDYPFPSYAQVDGDRVGLIAQCAHGEERELFEFAETVTLHYGDRTILVRVCIEYSLIASLLVGQRYE